MKELKENSVNIGSKVLLIFETLETNSVHEDRIHLKAELSIKYLDESDRKVTLDRLKGIEQKVWIQIGENERVYNGVKEKSSEDSEEVNISNCPILFELSNLMIKDLHSGATLFAGIEHPNYNVRTQEIPRLLSDYLA